jgi:polyisoprenyl-phosphate glycosyltransferase
MTRIAPRVSVAVPLYNEEQSFPELFARIRAVLDAIPGGPHEMVFVDDGSFDRTPQLLEAASVEDPRVVAVSLSRNFGHQPALTAALDHVTGEAVVLLDGDLQDPPEAIPRFLEKFVEGYDVVYAQRVKRKESWWLRLAYYGYYRVLSRMADLEMPLDAGDFSLLSRRVVEQLRRAPERHRYLRGLRVWAGFQQIGIPIERSARNAGTSKYSLWKLLRLAFDGIFSFSIVPLRLAAVSGMIAVLLSVLFAVYSLYAKLVLDQSPQGFTALILVITFLSGVHLFFLGIIGEYLGRVYEEVKARPLYVVGRVLRSEPTTAGSIVGTAVAVPRISAR